MRPLPVSIAAPLLAVLITLALITTVSAVPAGAGAPSEDLEETIDDVRSYVSVDDSGTVRFDRAAALAAGEPQEVLDAGARLEQVARSYEAHQNVPDGPRAYNGIPVWGNWCGPGHGGGTPRDTLDRLCMEHDNCYAARGYFDCECDARLRAGISRSASSMGAGERAMAAAISVYFSIQPCR
ncbi:hypothetical protein, partial [Sediminivirga luteola]|uniref:hypothetical protein n=1 Tax=Sediminivirga luteola TaxID=1774748 RepID=UPI001F597DD3